MASLVSVAYGAAAGTSPPTLVNSTGFASNTIPDDDSGIVQLGSGTATTTGVLCTITLGGNYSSQVSGEYAELRPSVTPINAATAALGIFVSSYSGHTITISCSVAPTASQTNTTYMFSYRT